MGRGKTNMSFSARKNERNYRRLKELHTVHYSRCVNESKL